MLRSLQELDLKGKKVFLRLDLNVPLADGKISDATRIEAALPTIKHILQQTNKVAICSHLGRPKSKPDPKYSLEPVGSKLAELLEREVVFSRDYLDESASRILDTLQPNQILLLENLRFYPGEESNDKDFAGELMKGFDFYVDDAFGAVHRAHASTVACAELLAPERRAAGFLIQKEVEALSQMIKNPKSPFVVIMGGSKVSDKIEVILNLLTKCNCLLIGGAMAYTFLKYRGVDVGISKTEDDKMDLVASIYRNAEARKVSIELPVDHIAAKSFQPDAEAIPVNGVALGNGLMGLDIGPRTISRYRDVIMNAQTVLWNGPMGVFEWPAFAKGSTGIAEALSQTSAYTLIGGGDSVAAANMAGVSKKISHISTGGGASLEFLEGITLPGLKVLSV